MGSSVRIEVDARTANVLQARADERGMSVSELAALDGDPALVAPEDVAELDRRWKKIEEGEATVPHHQVVRWLRSWGTPGFRPWHDQ